MTDLQNTLKQHVFGKVGSGLSLDRGLPFFYKDIIGTNPAHRVDVITASPDHHDWYFRIYDGNRLVCKDRHFKTAEEALAASKLIRTEAQATELRLRRIERWEGDHSYAVDGHTDDDTVICEVQPGRWWIFRDREYNQRQYSGPWTSLEEAFDTYRFELLKVN